MGLVAVLACQHPMTAQAPWTTTLVANDAITAEWVNTQTNVVGASQTHPAGPLVAASVQVSTARYSCSLVAAAASVEFTASTSGGSMTWPFRSRSHADLTLTITGTGIASLEVDLRHGGDGVIPNAMRIDVGDDGTVELESSWGFIGSPRHHRLWTWDFNQGALVVRIRTDQQTMFGFQGHSIVLRALPWSGHATPMSAACPASGVEMDPWLFEAETTNYQLAPEPATQTNQLLALRAFGFGSLGFFVASDTASLTPLQLPNLPILCPALANALFVEAGSVSATTQISGASMIPRQWTLAVPLLPPGIRFYVQHGSVATLASPAFGTSNVVRIDT